jgi:hypothetical protein
VIKHLNNRGVVMEELGIARETTKYTFSQLLQVESLIREGNYKEADKLIANLRSLNAVISNLLTQDQQED